MVLNSSRLNNSLRKDETSDHLITSGTVRYRPIRSRSSEGMFSIVYVYRTSQRRPSRVSMFGLTVISVLQSPSIVVVEKWELKETRNRQLEVLNLVRF